MELREKTHKAVDNILDVFAGGDGGVGFWSFRCLIEAMDAKAAKGDEAAVKIVSIVEQFSRLLDAAKKVK